MFAKALCVLTLIGAAAFAINEHAVLGRAGAEHQELLNRQQEAERLTRENGELEDLRRVNLQVKELERANHDLPKLRNDIQRLRKQAAEAAWLKAENARLSLVAQRSPASALPPDFVPRAALGDAGLSTPEATVQTYFNALSRGDILRLAQCSDGTARPQRPVPAEELAKERDNLLKQTSRFTGYRIVNRKDISADRVEINVDSGTGGNLFPMQLQLRNGEWTVQR